MLDSSILKDNDFSLVEVTLSLDILFSFLLCLFLPAILFRNLLTLYAFLPKTKQNKGNSTSD